MNDWKIPVGVCLDILGLVSIFISYFEAQDQFMGGSDVAPGIYGVLIGLFFIISSIFYFMSYFIKNNKKKYIYDILGSVMLLFGFVVTLPLLTNSYFFLVKLMGFVSLLIGVILLVFVYQNNKE